jgi:histidinol phosphatase-like enzyme (inositol monophosphatase family)
MTDAAPNPATLALDELGRFALDLADEARGLTRRWFKTGLAVDTKADATPVTMADRETEAALRTRIAATYPEHGILGEEHGRTRTDAEFVWVIDPIDGTKSFICGIPLWGTLLALLWRGAPVLGVIDMPALNERWIGRAGRATRYEGALCRTSGCSSLADARLFATSPDIFDADGWRAFDAVSRRVRMRRFGGDCYAYALVASGHVDLVIETGLQPYDHLPLVNVIEGAGGVFTDWEGKRLTPESDGRVIAAASASLHAQALAALREAAS